MERQYSQADVDALGAATNLAPKVTDFIGRPGFAHRQEVNKVTGRTEDVVSYTTNVGGVKTQAAHEVEEATKAFRQADVARFGSLQQKTEREQMIDASGSVRYVEEQNIDYASVTNRWRPRIKVRGTRVAKIDAYGRFVKLEG